MTIGWRHLLHGCTAEAWYHYMRHHAPHINSYHFFAKVIQLGWQTILKSWKMQNGHIHPPIMTQNDHSQLQTALKQIFYETQQDPNLHALITHTTVKEIMCHPTKYIRQWVTNSHKHMKDYHSTQAQQAQLQTPDIRQYFPQMNFHCHLIAPTKIYSDHHKSFTLFPVWVLVVACSAWH